MVPTELQQHLHTKHDCKDKPITFFKSKCDKLKHSQTNLTPVIKGENGNVCEASHKVSNHTACCREVCTTAETLSLLV
jgi:hypothetical protein